MALALFALPTAAQAGSGCQQDATGVADQIFDASDTDSDGALSPEEYLDAGLERYGVAFEAFDTNEDGETSRAEYLDLFRLHHPPSGARNI
jgi:hypothetical protein